MGLFLNLRVPKVWDSPRVWDCPRISGKSRDIGTVPKTRSPNTMEFIYQSQRPKSLGQFQAFGTVPEARDRLGTLGLSQRPRVPTPWSLFLKIPKSLGQSQAVGTFPEARDVGTVPKTQSPNTMEFISQSQTVPVPGLWDCPRSPGRWDCPKDPDFGTQRPRVSTPWSLFLNLKDPKAWESPRLLRLSQKTGTVPGRWDFPKTQSPNTMELISQSQRPKSLGQSQAFEPVPEARDSPGTLGLAQKPRALTPWNGVMEYQKAWDSPRSPGHSQF